MHVKSKCKPLLDRRATHLLFYAFRLAKNDCHIDHRNLPTRQNVGLRLKVPRSLKPIVLRSALYRAISLWNKLKPQYTLIDDLNSFKIAIKKDFTTCFM